MMKKENSFDNLLVQTLQEIAKDKEPHLIYEGVQQKLQQERKRAMKTTSKKRIGIATVCCFLLLGLTGFAIGKVTGYFGSAHFMSHQLPTEQELQKELGSVPTLVENFSNGYTFDSYYRGDTSQVDDNNTPIETVPMIDLGYIDKNQNRNGISLTIQPQWKQEEPSEADKTEMISGIQINIYEIENKFVPPNYEPTEEEIELQEQGLLNLAFGSDTVEENHSTLLTWQKDNLSYSLLYTGHGEVSAAELLDMAKEIIEK